METVGGSRSRAGLIAGSPGAALSPARRRGSRRPRPRLRCSRRHHSAEPTALRRTTAAIVVASRAESPLVRRDRTTVTRRLVEVSRSLALIEKRARDTVRRHAEPKNLDDFIAHQTQLIRDEEAKRRHDKKRRQREPRPLWTLAMNT